MCRYFKEFISTLRFGHKHKIIPFQKSNLVSNDYINKSFDYSSISLLKLEGPLFFGSTELVIDTYNNSQKHKFLIIDATNITTIDLSGIYTLEDLILNAKKNNITVFVFNTNPSIKLILEKVGFIKNIGEESYKESKDFINSLITIS
jgi:SulP family sulfate permease